MNRVMNPFEIILKVLVRDGIEMIISGFRMESESFYIPSCRVDLVLVSKNMCLELDIFTVNLIKLWKELAKVKESLRRSRFLIHFISTSCMNISKV